MAGKRTRRRRKSKHAFRGLRPATTSTREGDASGQSADTQSAPSNTSTGAPPA
jgi:hypothetical protein